MPEDWRNIQERQQEETAEEKTRDETKREGKTRQSNIKDFNRSHNTIREDKRREEKRMNDPVKAFDVDAALERMGGDSELLAELVDSFLQHAPEILHQIEGAAADGEARALEAAAHSLKGMAVYLDAMPVATLAERLEIMGHRRDLGKVREAVSDLASSMDELCEALSTFHLDRDPRKLV